MAYADVDDVLSILGRASVGVGQSGGPDPADIERFCDNLSSKLDAEFAARGVPLPLTTTAAVDALRPVIADGAALLTLGGLYPSGGADSPADRLTAQVEKRWLAALAAIEDGSSPIVKLLQVEVASGFAARAACFWEEEPLYDLLEPYEAMSLSAAVLPPFAKTMKL